MFRRTLNISLLAVIFSLCLASASSAQGLRLQSGPQRTALLELYTSEGCSSCPRADQWLSNLVEDERVWDKVVPIAFHVDYWDYIGWKDRFARPEFGARQRDYARQGHIKNVYTPGFVVGGEEWRGWFRLPTLSVAGAPNPGVLEVISNNGKVAARFEPTPAGGGRPTVHVAVLGFGLKSQIHAGENEGRQLEHDFVVLGYQKSIMAENGKAFEANVDLPEARVQAPRTALAVWVSEAGDQRPVQAVGGWM